MHYTAYDTRLASYAVVVDGEGGDVRVLLALWNEGTRRQWTLPGGGVELHENVEQGVVREVREETGYEAELCGLLGVDSYVLDPHRRHVDTDRPFKAVRTIFKAHVVGGELAPEVDGSTDEARWFSLDEIAVLDRVSVVDIGLRMAGLIA
ncbi:NUDIX hydrolase [Nocardioides bruguierae]|uniref:NUDIX domain-containing protein n=1 Tax=Nocardioides bruguierae TaxID=2945102 RepID=A0A9X2D965_9ACTN|nr:NUDIX domain-containing protein [Nocardioides bruguierae]MCL8023966.1 NUDIX domain-containing protein [Nocardioides bruguierae]MCM0620369.1 NUDIX domain-containing protein [Nocardioides bruguierae]